MRSFVVYKMTDTLARPPSSSRRIAWSFGRFSDIRWALVLTYVMRDKIQLDSYVMRDKIQLDSYVRVAR